MAEPDFLLPGASRDAQSVTPDWNSLQGPRIAGVALKELRHVITGYGSLTESYRADWGLDAAGLSQVFYTRFKPGGFSGWHAHARTTDRFFVAQGLLRIVLYDARQGSATRGTVDEFQLGDLRPGTLSVPPGIWHAVKNELTGDASLINMVDWAYQYEAPDHWRLPADSAEIPYKFL